MKIKISYAMVLLLLMPLAFVKAQKLPNAHSHNDYERANPFTDAFELGFGSIEADIHLVDGALLVGHDAKDLTAEKTLEAMYLNPLAEIAKKNGGKLPDYTKPLILLIDVKTDAEPTYIALEKRLKDYEFMLTHFKGDSVLGNCVTVIISGNRPVDLMKNETNRLAAIDGRLNEVDCGYSASLMPLVSMSVTDFGTEQELKSEPDSAIVRIKEFVKKCKLQNRKTRLWGVPDVEKYWDIQIAAGLDYIGTDSPQAFSNFMYKNK